MVIEQNRTIIPFHRDLLSRLFNLYDYAFPANSIFNMISDFGAFAASVEH